MESLNLIDRRYHLYQAKIKGTEMTVNEQKEQQERQFKNRKKIRKDCFRTKRKMEMTVQDQNRRTEIIF